jgi:hypothetical protein
MMTMLSSPLARYMMNEIEITVTEVPSISPFFPHPLPHPHPHTQPSKPS